MRQIRGALVSRLVCARTRAQLRGNIVTLPKYRILQRWEVANRPMYISRNVFWVGGQPWARFGQGRPIRVSMTHKCFMHGQNRRQQKPKLSKKRKLNENRRNLEILMKYGKFMIFLEYAICIIDLGGIDALGFEGLFIHFILQ